MMEDEKFILVPPAREIIRKTNSGTGRVADAA
jgi:hypothetical protein